jgi:DNA-directed RNA polymerase subunit RPC12/RpoP
LAIDLQSSNEAQKKETSTICPYCWKQFSVPETEGHVEGRIVTCPHCGKQSRLTGKTMTSRMWVLRKFAFLAAFAFLGVIGILIWVYGTIEHDIWAWVGLGCSVFFVVVFVVYVVITAYHVILIRTGREKNQSKQNVTQFCKDEDLKWREDIR